MPAATSILEFSTIARNGAVASDNKIHDDTVARQYGFAGGLVPGVTVYAYMSAPVVAALGLPWLERGTMSARFLKPFYEGEAVHVTATPVDGAVFGYELSAANADGVVCAVGQAVLPSSAGQLPRLADFPAGPRLDPRPPVSEDVLRGILAFPDLDEVFDPATNGAAYLEEVPDAFPPYHGNDAIAPTGFLIRRANTILAEAVRLDPWIHVSSEVTHFSLLRAGEAFTTRARMTGLFERKGHRFVRYDVLLATVEDSRPVMTVDHTAIYNIRLVPGS